MAPQTVTSLALLVAFVLPGFVTVLIQERTFGRSDGSTQLDRLLRALYYSGWSYLLLAICAVIAGVERADVESFIDRREDDPAELVLWATAVLLAPSVLIAMATQRWAASRPRAWVLEKLRINVHHGVDSAWDHIFAREQSAFVRVTTQNGERVLGFYGPSSFAAYARDDRDIFLEHTFQPTADGWFGEVMPKSRGVWIPTEDVVSIEFYSQGDEQSDSNSSRDPGGGASTSSGNDDAAAGTASSSASTPNA